MGVGGLEDAHTHPAFFAVDEGRVEHLTGAVAHRAGGPADGHGLALHRRPVLARELGCHLDLVVAVVLGHSCQAREVGGVLVGAGVAVEDRGVDGEGGGAEQEQHRSCHHHGRRAAFVVLEDVPHDSYLATAWLVKSTSKVQKTKFNS
jgi:hypothetical protein